MDAKGDRLVLLNVFSTDAEAHIVSGMLEANDIPNILDNQVFSSLYPIGFNSLGGIRMMVRESDYERALELLRENCDV